MKNLWKSLVICLVIFAFIGLVFLYLKNHDQPKTQNENVNEVITIIQELDKDSNKKR